MTYSTLKTISKYKLSPINKLARDGMSKKTNLATKKEIQQQKKEPNRISLLKLSYFHAIINAEIRNEKMPKTPKDLIKVLGDLVQSSAAPLKWAKKQPNYTSIRIKKLKKHNITESKKKLGEPKNKFMGASKEKSISALEKRIEENQRVINKALKEIEQDRRLISENKCENTDVV